MRVSFFLVVSDDAEGQVCKVLGQRRTKRLDAGQWVATGESARGVVVVVTSGDGG